MVIFDTGKYCHSTDTTSVGKQSTEAITSLLSHFHVQPPARLPCVTLSSSLVISGPGDSVCHSEDSGNVKWVYENSPVCAPMSSSELLCCPWVGLWGAADQTDVGPCPVLSHPSWYQKRRVPWPTGNHQHSFSKLRFLTQFSEISNVYGGNSLLEVLNASKNCTIKLIKPLKKHSNSTKVSCCTTSLLEEAVCIFKSVCKSFKSVVLQPQRVLQCSQKNCKGEIVNPWYSTWGAI